MNRIVLNMNENQSFWISTKSMSKNLKKLASSVNHREFQYNSFDGDDKIHTFSSKEEVEINHTRFCSPLENLVFFSTTTLHFSSSLPLRSRGWFGSLNSISIVGESTRELIFFRVGLLFSSGFWILIMVSAWFMIVFKSWYFWFLLETVQEFIKVWTHPIDNQIYE